MKDNQKRYLDKVVDILVSDTVIDYDSEKIKYPHLSNTRHITRYSVPAILFTEYCENTYGLSYEEIGYVWAEYKKVIIDKTEDER